MKKKLVETVVLLLKGGAIGVANIIPGVSGGTLAVVLGIYDRLIESISRFFDRPEKRKEYIFFLVKVFSGAVAALVLLAKVMDLMLTEHFHKTMFLFMGLILGGIPAVIRSHGDMKIRTSRILAFIIGVILVLGISVVGKAQGHDSMTVVPAVQGTSSYVMLAIAGFLAGGAMIVPGVSGTFILVLMGQYVIIIGAIKDLAMKPLGFVALGAVAGVMVFSRIIEICLEKIPSVTYYFILGLILASFYKIFPGIPADRTVLLYCVGAFVVGAIVSYALSKVSAE